MNLEYYYWYFTKAVPERICDDIVRYGKESEKEMALTGHQRTEPPSKEELKNIKKKRKSDIVWMSDKWIYKEIHPFIADGNVNAGWNHQWDWSEACQFTEYKKGQFYDWHMDSWAEPYKDNAGKDFVGKIRKLSSVLLLSQPGKDFEGGEFEIDFSNGGSEGTRVITEINTKGAFIVFPSFVKHRVRPVTKGTRYSMPMWHLGEPWK